MFFVSINIKVTAKIKKHFIIISNITKCFGAGSVWPISLLGHVFYCGGFLSVLRCVPLDSPTWLSGDKERPDLHADGLDRIPAPLPVHPHHAVVCAVLGHLPRVGSAHVVTAVGIGRVAAVVPPTTSILPGALFGGIAGDPRSEKRVKIHEKHFYKMMKAKHKRKISR